jgi:hypothetical protein
MIEACGYSKDHRTIYSLRVSVTYHASELKGYYSKACYGTSEQDINGAEQVT